MVLVHTSDIEHIHRRVVGKLEPEVIIVPDTELEIPINITVVVDYAIYKCEVKNIELPDTQIMKVRILNLYLTVSYVNSFSE